MVKHGRNKKRRAGRIGRTKLKNKNFKRWDPKPKINDPTIKTLWDAQKTPRQNLANMGIAMEPNGIDRGLGSATSSTPNAAAVNAIELFEVPDSDAPSRRDRIPMTEEEQEYIVQCMAKYGTNYSKMFRNTKVNTLQHTQEKLQKMGARFLLLEPAQVLVDKDTIPEKLLEKMEHGQTIQEEVMAEKE